MLMWHRQLRLIDHGAALYFHHAWEGDRSRDPFPLIKDHVLLRFAGDLAGADAAMTARITPAVVARVAGLIPGSWLGDQPREAYVDHLTRRLAAPRAFVEEAIRARAGRMTTPSFACCRASSARSSSMSASSCRAPAPISRCAHRARREPAACARPGRRRGDSHASRDLPVICAGGPASARSASSPRARPLARGGGARPQTSPVHTGRCADPRATLDHLLDSMVRPPRIDAGNGTRAGMQGSGGPAITSLGLHNGTRGWSNDDQRRRQIPSVKVR